MKVFSKQKFIEVEGIAEYQYLVDHYGTHNWVDACDGAQVQQIWAGRLGMHAVRDLDYHYLGYECNPLWVVEGCENNVNH